MYTQSHPPPGDREEQTNFIVIVQYVSAYVNLCEEKNFYNAFLLQGMFRQTDMFSISS